MGRPSHAVPAALLLVVALLAAACGGSSTSATGGGGGTLRISGSSTVNPVAADAAEALRRRGLTVTVDSQGGSAGGIAQLGTGEVDIVMSSKEVMPEDEERFPQVDFVATEIGADAVAVVVRREVFDGGVTSLTREQLRAVFEGRVRRWSELGGPGIEVFVFDKEPGRGTREVLDTYLYGSDAQAPPPPESANYAVVGGNEEARTKVLSTRGAVTPLSTAFANGQPDLAAVAVDRVEPTPAHVRDKTYPMARPLLLITDGAPRGPARTFVDYVLSKPGQALVARHGFLTVAELAP